jgi:prepilin-type N-terminal cleavage/methylation domain-containing protein
MTKPTTTDSPRRGFTLVELLIVMSILAILAGLTVAGLAAVVNNAREARTRSIIGKIDLLIDERWEGYRTRAVPVRITAGISPIVAAQMRLSAMRALQRMELPDRRTDIVNFTTTPPTPEVSGVTGMVPTSLQRTYFRLAVRATGGNPSDSTTWISLNTWSMEHEGSECLYLILSAMKDGDKSALEFFTADEIGDTDGDGMREILDGWGRPIAFLRWAPGYSQHQGLDGAWGVAGADDDGNGTADDIFEAGWEFSDDVQATPVTTQTRIATRHPTLTSLPFAPDPFDPVKVDPRWAYPQMNPFALKPLLFSAGVDGAYDVSTRLENEDASPAEQFRYSQSHTYAPPPDGSPRVPHDPYFLPPASWNQFQPGTVDITGGGWADNITNHDFDTN